MPSAWTNLKNKLPKNKLLLKTPAKFYWIVSLVIVGAVGLWQLLFFKNEHIEPVLADIHVIYLSTLLSFLLLKLFLSSVYLDLVKIFVRTLFRVWLLILITLSITRSMDRVGLILSITFIFGYFEGLLDLDKWIKQHNPLKKWIAFPAKINRFNHGLTTLLFMSLLHLCFAIVILIFSLFFM